MRENKRTPLTIAWLTAAALIVASPVAHGFMLRTTDLGDLIRWRVDVVEVFLDPSLSDLGDRDLVEDSVAAAFEAWRQEAELDLEFVFTRAACVDADTAQKSCIYATDAEEDPEGDAGATTRLSFVADTGELIGADIAFFSQVADWSLSGEEGALDVYSVALHEAGHFLGLDHSAVSKAAMFPWTDLEHTGSTELHDDDIYGAQALYDDRMKRNTNCSAAPGERGGGLLGVLLGLLL